MIILKSSLFNNFSHGFFSRRGGVSYAPYDSLNCHSKSMDKPENVRHNLHSVAESMQISAHYLKKVTQVHSNRVVVVESLDQITHEEEADALVTTLPGVLLTIQTADCVPIIFADREKKVIGIAHAGWRGTFAGIIMATVTKMQYLGATGIKAAIGPCIRQQNYEVDYIFYKRALEANKFSKVFFIKANRANHYLFDLPGYCAMLMVALGIEVDDSSVDTYANPQLFFSYRREYHKSLEDSMPVRHGCQISAVAL